MGFFNMMRNKKKSGLNKSKKLLSNVSTEKSKKFKTTDKLGSIIDFSSDDYLSGRYRNKLYRFLSDSIPVINACISTWTRLSAVQGKYVVDTDNTDSANSAEKCLKSLSENIYCGLAGNGGGLVTFLTEVFNHLYRDGLYAGFLTVKKDSRGIDKFMSIESSNLVYKDGRLFFDTDQKLIELSGDDFYFIPLNGDRSHPLGKSILKSIPFVSYIEQQLIDDMRRSSHNAGFNRMHVKIAPPERMGGESDKLYYDRINNYFDSTVSMIKSCDVDENPVTWDNISIESVGPRNVRSVSNSWFMNHRAIIEEICAGTGLAPFLLGYSYGATTSWAAFKFDIVMRQVNSVQAEVASFMEWIGNIELALAGYNYKCKFEFDNTFTYRETEQSEIKSKEVENILKLYQAGLIKEEDAKNKIGSLI